MPKKLTRKCKVLNQLYLMWINDIPLLKENIWKECESLQRKTVSTVLTELIDDKLLQNNDSEIYSLNFGELIIENYFNTNFGTIPITDAGGNLVNYPVHQLYLITKAKIKDTPQEEDKKLILEWEKISGSIIFAWKNIGMKAAVDKERSFPYNYALIIALILKIKYPFRLTFQANEINSFLDNTLDESQLKKLFRRDTPLLLYNFFSAEKYGHNYTLQMADELEKAILRQILKIQERENELLENYIKAKKHVHQQNLSVAKQEICPTQQLSNVGKEEEEIVPPAKKQRITSAQQTPPIVFDHHSSLISSDSVDEGFKELLGESSFMPQEKDAKMEIVSEIDPNFNTNDFFAEEEETQPNSFRFR